MIMYPDNILHGAYDKPGYLKMISIDWFKHFLYSLHFMIILTGYKGFIGKHLKKESIQKILYRVEQSHAFDF